VSCDGLAGPPGPLVVGGPDGAWRRGRPSFVTSVTPVIWVPRGSRGVPQLPVPRSRDLPGGGEARGGRWAAVAVAGQVGRSLGGRVLWGRGQSAGGTGPYRSVGEGGLWAGRTRGGPAGATSGPAGAAGKQKRERIWGPPSADVQALSIL
jgi:hypothetical protein